MGNKKLIFKPGDRVFHFASGWGKIINCEESLIFTYYIRWDDDRTGYSSEEYLSFTEYVFEGFSQSRPEKLPERGMIVWAKDFDDTNWFIGHFWQKDKDSYCISPSNHGHNLSWFDEMITENPHKK